MSTTLEAIVDEARLLKPGDVVAVAPRGGLAQGEFKHFAAQVKALNERVPLVTFVAFFECDLTVLRPVDD